MRKPSKRQINAGFKAMLCFTRKPPSGTGDPVTGEALDLRTLSRAGQAEKNATLEDVKAELQALTTEQLQTLRDYIEEKAAPVETLRTRYKSLRNVLNAAFNQAAIGKGYARHANALPFEQQPMQTISRLLGSHQGLLFQAIKKTQESVRLERPEAIRELLGAINYLAGAVIYLEGQDGQNAP